jgi:methionyl-tRNA formyltransferase
MDNIIPDVLVQYIHYGVHHLNIIFAGTPQLAVPLLETLIESEHHVVMVLTQPDRPAGRGRQLTASPIKQCAEQHGIPVYQPSSLKNNFEAIEKLQSSTPDIMIVMAYGLIIPTAILTLPRLGCVNAHVSLLPRWRGAAPIARAILAGDKTTGITLMQMDAGLDTGDMLAIESLDIADDETTDSLSEKLSQLTASLTKKNLTGLLTQKLIPIKQDNSHANYAKKIDVAEACIDWSHSAEDIERMIRAFNPWPIAYTFLNHERLRLWKADVINKTSPENPGTIIQSSKQGIDIATGENILRITQLQLPGKKIQQVHDIMNGQHPFQAGKLLAHE